MRSRGGSTTPVIVYFEEIADLALISMFSAPGNSRKPLE
jgi:hypothetical protein